MNKLGITIDKLNDGKVIAGVIMASLIMHGDPQAVLDAAVDRHISIIDGMQDAYPIDDMEASHGGVSLNRIIDQCLERQILMEAVWRLESYKQTHVNEFFSDDDIEEAKA